MSRSRRKTAIIGMTSATSDKPFKVDEHRAERHAVRAVVKRSLDNDDKASFSKVYGDPWKSPKDGKQMVDPNSKWMRKRHLATSLSSEWPRHFRSVIPV